MRFETEFESGQPGFDATITRCVVSEQANQVTRWDQVIDTKSDCFINLTWETEGVNAGAIFGNWYVQAFLEGLGSTPPELNPPALSTTIAMGIPTLYQASIRIPANTIPVLAGQTMPYKVVVTVTAGRQGDNRPYKLAGYVELPVLEFYNAP